MEPIELTEDIDLIGENVVWEEKTTQYEIKVKGTSHTIRIMENSNGTEFLKFTNDGWEPFNMDDETDNLIHEAYLDGVFY
jgi:hypothetical protein